MVLLFAVASGWIGGYLRARWHKQQMRIPDFQFFWIVFVAYIPQFFAFYFPATQELIPDLWIPLVLIGSQFLLLVFTWINRRIVGVWLLGFGLLCNFVVITLNGGFMPLMPEVAEKLIAPGSNVVLTLGKRVGLGKDVLLLKEETLLWFLGDVFTLPGWMKYPLAFSVGDILISVGAFWLLWELGRPPTKPEEVSP